MTAPDGLRCFPHGPHPSRWHAKIGGKVILGVRIEFYKKVGDVGEPSQDMLGALYRDHGFRAAGAKD